MFYVKVHIRNTFSLCSHMQSTKSFQIFFSTLSTLHDNFSELCYWFLLQFSVWKQLPLHSQKSVHVLVRFIKPESREQRYRLFTRWSLYQLRQPNNIVSYDKTNRQNDKSKNNWREYMSVRRILTVIDESCALFLFN